MSELQPHIAAVLFDMDGVIRHWPTAPTEQAEDAADLPRGALLEAAFRVPEYAAGVLGEVTWQGWVAATENALAATYGDSSARIAVSAWDIGVGDLDAEMVELVRRVRRRVPVCLLSNAHDRLRFELHAHGLDQAFDAVVCSAEVRVAKPDPQIYRVAAAAVDAEPEHCFFVDDLSVNVEAARAVGMTATVFAGADALEASLVEVGVLAG